MLTVQVSDSSREELEKVATERVQQAVLLAMKGAVLIGRRAFEQSGVDELAEMFRLPSMAMPPDFEE